MTAVVAWMRMMGADSVAYHQATVMGRGDDHAGRALRYYASRGETALVWGGRGAARLGLVGAVTDVEYAAIYGPGGARDPLLPDRRLVATRRPGMELVISAHKSVAELGVIGRAEDMHWIMDAERDATLGYLDAVTGDRGGRRGRSQKPVRTSGLVYAVTRHATSRAGDPCPHDHVLLANVVETLDEVGGWKAADTNVWRDELHAATVVGRLAAARVAVELGYSIEPDHGVSGRLGHWKIAGVPDEVLEVHSKRAADIDEAMSTRGYDTYRARNIAARTTRVVKRHTPVDDLLTGWQSELEAVGWPVERLSASVDEAARELRVEDRLTLDELHRLVAETVGADGPLSARKVFTRSDVIVAVVPKLYGRPPGELSRVVDRIIKSREVIPLLRVSGARQQAYSTASVVATETAIADIVARGVTTGNGAAIPVTTVEAAIAMKEAVLRGRLTRGQAGAVHGICADGHQISLVLGVAGAGKTTALDCVRAAYQTAGYTVLGTATSGQAARTLGREAGIESRTIASLLWRLDHHRLTLDGRTVLFADEAGMTDDADLLRLLVAAQTCGTKVVMVGDHRQLGAIGPGGALEAVLSRHDTSVYELAQNVRQHDHQERVALSHLRDGDITKAVSWYRRHGRITVSADRDTAIADTADAWAADSVAGYDTAIYAWRRANVDALNHAARARWEAAGRLSGPELGVPGGRRFRAGDRIVTLHPGADGQIVTSERGVVTAVNPATRELVARMDDGRTQTFSPAETAADRLAHGYAVTVHRCQGATVDIAHHLADGGGRELAYVAMSRARHKTTVHVVADDLDQAVEDLHRDWTREQRPRWAIDTGTPGSPRHIELGRIPTSVRRGVLLAERDAIAALLPPDHDDELRRVEHTLAQVHDRRDDLARGKHVRHYADLRAAAKEMRQAERELAEANRVLQHDLSWRNRRHWKHTAAQWTDRLAAARRDYDHLVQPHLARLDTTIDDYNAKADKLRHAGVERTEWLQQHPNAARRLHHLSTELDHLDTISRTENQLDRLLERSLHRQPHGISRVRRIGHDATPGIDHGVDLGL